MSDRELLEAAAMAAGGDAKWDDEMGHMVVRTEHKGLAYYYPWTPLDDDGDAFRLAVALDMQIRPEPAAVCVGWDKWQSGAPTSDGRGPWFYKEYLRSPDDHYAATRRAIVRAAAATAGNGGTE